MKKQILAHKQDLETASKSSAGDKHETARAMIHLEQEKLGFQYQQVFKQLKMLSQCDVYKHATIQSGSLILTDKALIYISVALGKIQFKNKLVYVISPVSPLAQVFLNANATHTLSFQGTPYVVLEIM
ncbi:MAG: hypothetical protein QNK65_05495 [Flavobacteriales bacterium]